MLLSNGHLSKESATDPKRSASDDTAQLTVEFLKKINESLPIRYVATNIGIFLADLRTRKPKGERICSLFRVVAMARSSDSKDWTWLIEVLTPDILVNELLIPKDSLTAKRRETLGKLQANGMDFTPFNEIGVLELFQAWQPRARVVTVNSPGWDSKMQAFVMPDGAVETSNDINDSYMFADAKQSSRAGSFKEWQSEVAHMCVGNPYLIFGVSLALAGPLLEPMELDSGLFHLHGDTSIGKSASLRVANSVWRSEQLQTWKTTTNGLEGRLAIANSTFLAIDELPKEPHQGFENDIYMIGNGLGKQRSDTSGRALKPAGWRMYCLSTGENDLATVLKSMKKDRHGGQTVRFIDIFVNRGQEGSFDAIHGHKDGNAFVSHLRQAAIAHAGHAGPEFVKEFLQRGCNGTTLCSELRAKSNLFEKQICDKFKLEALEPEVTRVLERYAVIALAGEMATKYGVTGWPQGTADNAVSLLIDQWFHGRGGNNAVDRSDAIARTREYLEAYVNSDFIDIEGFDPNNREWFARVNASTIGYHDANWFYITPRTLKLIHSGQDLKRIVRFHHEAGLLKELVDGYGAYRNNFGGKIRPRTYNISKSILEA